MSVVSIFISLIILVIRITILLIRRNIATNAAHGVDYPDLVNLDLANGPEEQVPAPEETIVPVIFQRADDELPEGLYLQRTCFAWRDLTLTGSLRTTLLETEVAVFELSYRDEDRHKLTQTITAFRRKAVASINAVNEPADQKNGIVFEMAGDWLILYVKGTIVPGNLLERWVNHGFNLAMASAVNALAPAA